VSGSGKTTLAREVLFPLLQQKLGSNSMAPGAAGEENGDDESAETLSQAATLSGYEALGEVVLVDQSALGRTPRSNPVVYVGAFEFIREIFATTEAAKQRGLNASAFSFNSGQGNCEKCRGAGFEKIEMQFLSDVFVTCPDCNGRRYREHILEVKIQKPKAEIQNGGWSIADLLEATVDEVVEFLAGLPPSRSRERALAGMRLLQDVGLGYLRAGQPINTLSGGESQRLKLVSHLAQSTNNQPKNGSKPKFFILDEPTTGLHFDDVRVLVDVFQRIVDEGHSLLVIEHNLELIRCADWLIDLGPEAGDRGGEVVGMGNPEKLSQNHRSFTGRALARACSTVSTPAQPSPVAT
jgi:excinuclease ABC subunit A